MHLFAAVFVALPFVYLAAIYGDLPERVPIHFDWRGQPDGYGPKAVLWLLPTFCIPLVLVSLASLRKRSQTTGVTPKQRTLSLITLVFISLLVCYILYSAAEGGAINLGVFSILMGVFFAALGNYMPVLPPNRWMGFRIPATLNSPYKWRKTHQLAGVCYLLGGVALVLNGLLLPVPAVGIGLIAIIILISLIPLVYALTLRVPPTDDLV